MPLVSFLTATFGRVEYEPHLLNECVAWFARQTHPDCELVLGNDNPSQTIVCTVPGVRVVNFPKRFPTFGEKLNAILAECRGEIVLPQDDDDVSLPHRAAQAVAALNDRWSFWTPGRWWLTFGNRIIKADGNGVGWNCGAFCRKPFLGRYAAVYAQADRLIKEWAMANVACKMVDPPPDDQLSYVYRWGTSRYHFSGRSDLKAAYDEAPCGGSGTFEVVARPGVDWVSLTRDAVRTVASPT